MKYSSSFFSKPTSKFLMKYIALKRIPIYLTICTALLLDCSGVSTSQSSKDKSTGDIYGKVTISGISNSTDSITVWIQNWPAYSTKTDSNGYFFIPNIPTGKYSIVARKAGFADCIIEKVEVCEDSISFLVQHILYKSDYKEIWYGVKIKKVDINSKGNMEGFVVNSQTNQRLRNVFVFIKGTPWVALTDSAGTFKIYNIIKGTYNVVTSLIGFHQTKIEDIIIEPERTSIVDIQITNIGIPEKPIPYKWTPKYLIK